MNQLVVDFINAYAESLEWNERGVEAVSRALCERYAYSPDCGRDLLMIAYGWMWGRSKEEMPNVEANCLCGMLQLKLNEVYRQVSKENGWG